MSKARAIWTITMVDENPYDPIDTLKYRFLKIYKKRIKNKLPHVEIDCKIEEVNEDGSSSFRKIEY